jgi:hypothetical protein
MYIIFLYPLKKKKLRLSTKRCRGEVLLDHIVGIKKEHVEGTDKEAITVESV